MQCGRVRSKGPPDGVSGDDCSTSAQFSGKKVAGAKPGSATHVPPVYRVSWRKSRVRQVPPQVSRTPLQRRCQNFSVLHGHVLFDVLQVV